MLAGVCQETARQGISTLTCQTRARDLIAGSRATRAMLYCKLTAPSQGWNQLILLTLCSLLPNRTATY